MADRPKILIVEDDAAVRRLVTHVTKRTIPAAIIATASDGREALDIIRASGADLVITDSQMPRMNGDELVRTMRAQQLNTPVIMVSGSPDAQPLARPQESTASSRRCKLEPTCPLRFSLCCCRCRKLEEEGLKATVGHGTNNYSAGAEQT